MMGAVLPGHELEGHAAIARFLGVSTGTVKRLIARASDQNPLPTVKYLGSVYASERELAAWRSREARRGGAAA
jgi:hypothetical protein